MIHVVHDCLKSNYAEAKKHKKKVVVVGAKFLTLFHLIAKVIITIVTLLKYPPLPRET